MTTLIEDLQAILDPLAPGGAWYGVNTTEPLAQDANGIQPFIVWQRIVSTTHNTLIGPSDLQNTRIQIDIYAPRIADAVAISAAVQAAFAASSLQFFQLSSQDLYEEPVRLFRLMQDFSIWAVN